MVAKSVLLLCASALFVQINGQYYGPGSVVSGNSVVDNDVFISGGYGGLGLGGLGVNGLAVGSGLGSVGLGSAGFGGIGLGGIGLGSVGVAAPAPLISASTLSGLSGYNIVAGGPLAVTTISPIGPSGLAVASENLIEGVLSVSGQLPFLSAVAFEGALPTAGSGIATCGCGSGQVGIVSEGPAAVPSVGLGGIGVSGLGVNGLGLGVGGGLGLGVY